MSGIDEIAPWAVEHFPPSNYDTFGEWFQAVDADFEANNRLPLGEILQDEIDVFEEIYLQNRRFDMEVDSDTLPNYPEQEIIDDYRLEQNIIAFFDLVDSWL